MDPSIPPGAVILLDFIRKTETGRDGDSAYTTIYRHNENKLAKPLTAMTLSEVRAAQAGWTKRFGSSAAGAYQFMKATLTELENEFGLTGNELMSPDLQDRFAFRLLKRRGYDDFVAGKIGAVAFAKALAQEWASLPVLQTTKGAHRQVARGQSYYAGDGMNAALVQPNEIETLLARVLVAQNTTAAPTPAPDPSQPASGIWAAVVWLVKTILSLIPKRKA